MCHFPVRYGQLLLSVMNSSTSEKDWVNIPALGSTRGKKKTAMPGFIPYEISLVSINIHKL